MDIQKIEFSFAPMENDHRGMNAVKALAYDAKGNNVHGYMVSCLERDGGMVLALRYYAALLAGEVQ